MTRHGRNVPEGFSVVVKNKNFASSLYSILYYYTSRNVVVRALQALTDIKLPFPTPWEKESKIPKIGVDSFCLKSVLTEFHVSNSIGFQKGLKLWGPF